MKRSPKLTVTISPISFVYLAVVVAMVAMLWYLSGIVVIIVASLIFAAGLNPSVKRLEKMRFPRWLAVSIIYTFVFVLIGYLVFLITPSINDQVTTIVKNFPEYRSQIDQSLSSQPLLKAAFDRLALLSQSRPDALADQVGQAATGAIGSVFGFITFLVLTFYFLMSGREILVAVVRYVPGRERQKEIMEIGSESSIKLGRWIRYQLIMSLIVFITTYIILTLLGVKVALSLALFAGVLQFVPFIGAFIGAVPAALAALVISPTAALIFIALTVVIQLILANVISPQLFNKAIGVSPVIILLAALVGFTLLGPIGIILAVPVAAIIDVVFDTMGSDYVKEKIDEATKS
jgi:predicted PurR-regulated permease PerM